MSLWINGEWRPGRGPGFSKQDPVNLKVVWQGEAADAGQVAEAVAAARQAFPAWARSIRCSGRSPSPSSPAPQTMRRQRLPRW